MNGNGFLTHEEAREICFCLRSIKIDVVVVPSRSNTPVKRPESKASTISRGGLKSVTPPPDTPPPSRSTSPTGGEVDRKTIIGLLGDIGGLTYLLHPLNELL